MKSTTKKVISFTTGILIWNCLDTLPVDAQKKFNIQGERVTDSNIKVEGNFTFNDQGQTNNEKFPQYSFFFKNNSNNDALTITSTNGNFSIPDQFAPGNPVLGIAEVDPNTYPTTIGQSINFSNGRVPPGTYTEPVFIPAGFLNERYKGTITKVPEPLTILGSFTAICIGAALKKKHSRKLQEANAKG